MAEVDKKRKITKIFQDANMDIRNLVPTSDAFLQALLDGNALNGSDVENVQDMRGRKEKRKELIEILQEKPKDAYFTFVRVLEKHEEDLYKRLKALEAKHELRPKTPVKVPVYDEYDVMISYCWKPDGNQQKMIQLRDKLKENNLRVWMDIDEMYGNMNDRMVDGVTKSKVIVACLSEEYQNSDNCRREYEFAARKKKPIVPVKTDKHRIEEWLELLAGNIIYREVGSDEQMKQNLPTIIGDIRKYLGGQTVTGD